MPDWVTDQQPYAPPPEAAATDYGDIAPSSGDAFKALFQDASSTLMLGRAAERGGQGGASDVDQGFARMQADQTAGMEPDAAAMMVAARDQVAANQGRPAPDFAPRRTAILSAAEANRLYAPEGTTITDKPIEEGLAQVLSQQKYEQIQRQGVLQRYAQSGPSWPVRFAAGTAAFLLDPLNAATAFVPGIGEDAIAARVGFAAARQAPLFTRLGIRAASGFTGGAVAQAPLSALRMSLSPEEGVDYGLREAALDMTMSGGLNAVIHGGLSGPLGDLFKARAARARGADPVVEAPAPTRYAAMSAAVAQIAEGRQIETTPIFDEAGLRSTTDGAAAAARETHEDYLPQARADVAEYQGRPAADHSLFREIRALGGIRMRDAQGEPYSSGPDIEDAAARLGAQARGLARKNAGVSPEHMAAALADRGWFGATPGDPSAAFQDAFNREAGGEKVYHPDSVRPGAMERRATLDEDMNKAGVQPEDSAEEAAHKLARYRATEVARAPSDLSDLMQRAQGLGVAVRDGVGYDELLGDVIEREAIQGDVTSGDLDAHEREISGHLTGRLSGADLERLNRLAREGLSAEHGEGPGTPELFGGGEPSPGEAAGGGVHAEGAAGGGEGASARPTDQQRWLSDERLVEGLPPHMRAAAARGEIPVRRVSAGPGGVATVTDVANLAAQMETPGPVFHETSLVGARALLPALERATARLGGLHVSPTRDLALGQGGRGIRIELDPARLQGHFPDSVANQAMGGTGQGAAEAVVGQSVRGAVRAIEVSSKAQLDALRLIPGLERRFDFDNATAEGKGFRIERRAAPEGAEVPADARAPPPHAPPTDADLVSLAKQQAQMYENGYAPGIPQNEFDQANEDIYGKPDEEEAKLAEQRAVKAVAAPEGEPALSDAQAQLADMEARWAARNGAEFQTSKGSIYQIHDDGTTTRDKAVRDQPGHEGDAGPKEKSARTVYVDTPDGAASLSAAGLQNLGPKGARVIIDGDRASLLTWNEKGGGWGISPSSKDVPISTEPGIGKAPLELWGAATDVAGHEAYSNMHAGNEIVSINRGSAPLLPEEHAELAQTALNVAKADKDAAGYEQAGACLGRAGV